MISSGSLYRVWREITPHVQSIVELINLRRTSKVSKDAVDEVYPFVKDVVIAKRDVYTYRGRIGLLTDEGVYPLFPWQVRSNNVYAVNNSIILEYSDESIPRVRRDDITNDREFLCCLPKLAACGAFVVYDSRNKLYLHHRNNVYGRTISSNNIRDASNTLRDMGVVKIWDEGNKCYMPLAKAMLMIYKCPPRDDCNNIFTHTHKAIRKEKSLYITEVMKRVYLDNMHKIYDAVVRSIELIDLGWHISACKLFVCKRDAHGYSVTFYSKYMVYSKMRVKTKSFCALTPRELAIGFLDSMDCHHSSCKCEHCEVI